MTVPDFEATADAFNRLSDPVRVELLRALWLEGRHDAVSYAALKDAIGVRDSGRFNYHLQRLTDVFVEKTEDGYRLTPAGVAVVDAVQSETFAPSASVDPTPVDADCPTCGVAFEATYDDGMFAVECPDCDRVGSRFVFPPRGVRVRDPADAARAHAIDANSRSRRAALGLCPYCGGRTESRLPTVDGLDGHDVVVRHKCRDCDGTVRSTVGSYAHDHPATKAFCHDHGVDPRGPAWQFEWCVDPSATTVEQSDPLRATATIALDGDELRLTFDETGAVVREERVERA
jgi:hypothetical protein